MGLVQDDQGRVSEQRPGEPNPLLLTTGKPMPMRTHIGIIAVGQLQDHLVGIGQHRRFNHRCVIGLPHARNVLGDGPGKQLDSLGQVADVLAKPIGIPACHVRAVQPHLTSGSVATRRR